MNRRRRDLMLGLAGLPAALAGCGGGAGETAPAPHAGPNVLMIVIDDLNDWVGYLGGHPQVQTPNMDRLAARAHAFERAYCAVPVCNGSRASALTGMPPQVTKVWNNEVAMRTVYPDAITLQQVFMQNGYNSIGLGKVFHGPDPASFHAYTSRPRQAQPSPVPYTNLECSGHEQLGIGAFDWAPLDIADSESSDGKLADMARAVLQQPASRPFFISLGLFRTHVAWYTPRAYFDLYPESEIFIPEAPPGDLDDLPPTARAYASRFNFHDCITRQNLWASAVRAYLASISFVDAQVGRVLDALDNGPHASNTVVVLWSDNGFHLGEKFHWHKLTLWEHSTRVPFIVSAPGLARPGARIGQSVGLLDMFPTVLDLCRLPPRPGVMGRSLVPLMSTTGLAWDHPVLTTLDEVHHAVRSNRWRYIEYENGERELYDQSADPAEYTNLESDPAYADVIASLRTFIPA